MSIRRIKSFNGTPPGTRNTVGQSTDIWFNESTGKINYTNTAGSAQALSDSGAANVADNTVFGIGTDSDGVLYNKSTSTLANTAITSTLVGTPVTPALAANTTIISNITADGDLLLATQTGGNSQAVLWSDSSASLLTLYAAGVPQMVVSAVGVTVPDGKLSRTGTSGNQAQVNVAAGLATNTTLANVMVGTPVTNAIAANSFILSNITASGDIQIAANRGGNSEDYLFIDSSAGVLYLAGYQGGIALGLVGGNPAPDGGSVHIWDGTAGSVTADTSARLVIETSGTTNSINFLGPTNTTAQGIYFGDTTATQASLLYSHSTDRMSLVVGGASSVVYSATHNIHIAGRVLDFITVSTIATDSNQNYTAAQMLGGVIIRSQAGARTDGADTAANICTALPHCVIGSSFTYTIDVTGGGSVAHTGANTGITYVGDATAIATTKSATFRAVVTTVGSAVTIYRVTGP